MSKAKGTRAERELLHMLFDNGAAVLRTAGSGSTTIPSCDLLVGKNGKVIAIECKFIKNSIYIKKERISELIDFSDKFGAEPWFGIKIMSKGWYFLSLDKIEKSSSGENYVINLEKTKRNGMNFNDFISILENKK